MKNKMMKLKRFIRTNIYTIKKQTKVMHNEVEITNLYTTECEEIAWGQGNRKTS